MANKILGLPGKTWGALIIVMALVVVALNIGAGAGVVPQSLAGGQAQTAETVSVDDVQDFTEISGTCELSSDISVTYSVFDSFKAGTSLNSDYNIVRYEDGVYAGNTSAGTAFTVAPNTTVTMYLVDSDDTHDVYGFADSIKVGCKDLSLQTFRGMQDGSLDLKVYQSDDVTENTGSTPETLGSGAIAQGRLRIKENTDDGYWSTTEGGQKFLIATDINKNAFSNFEIQTVSDGTVTKSATPISHSSQDATNNQLTISYEIESDALRDYGIVDVYFITETLGSVNPTSDANLLFTVFDKELYLNVNTGEWKIDYSNAVTNADVGETNVTDVYHII